MKKGITKAEQQRINELLKARRERESTKELSVSMQRERLSLYEEGQYVRRDGLTHLEYVQLESYKHEKL